METDLRVHDSNREAYDKKISKFFQEFPKKSMFFM